MTNDQTGDVLVDLNLLCYLTCLVSLSVFEMRLGTYFLRNNTHVYTKSHNSGFNNYLVMPLLLTLKKQTSLGIFSMVTLVLRNPLWPSG